MTVQDGMDSVDSNEVGADYSGAPVGNDNAPDDSAGGGHPAWKEVLDQIPDSLHPVVTPALQKWDTGVQQKIQQVQSQYAPYESLIEQGYEPDSVAKAMHVMNMIENNPQEFYSKMGEFYKFGQQSDQGREDVYDLGDDDENQIDPRFAKLEEQQQIVAQGLYNIYQKEQEAAEDAALAQEIDRLKGEHGEFDEQFVLRLAATDGNLEGAVKSYFDIVSKARSAPTPGSNLPNVIAPGGGTPSQNVNPADLNSKDTRSLVANLLAKMNES